LVERDFLRLHPRYGIVKRLSWPSPEGSGVCRIYAGRDPMPAVVRSERNELCPAKGEKLEGV